MRGRPWRLLFTAPCGGGWNLALDVALLLGAAREDGPPTLRFYSWDPPAVSLGRFQPLDSIDRDYARRRGWELVRRPTGGRAVLHQHEVTYSVVLPPSVAARAGVRSSYRVLTAALNAGLGRLLGTPPPPAPPGRAPACEARRSRQPNCFALADERDSLVSGGKLVGSAQVRQNGALLQHGSILLEAEREAWTALFGSAGRLVSLRDLLGAVPPPGQVAAAVMSGFQSLGVVLERGELSPSEESRAVSGSRELRIP